MAAVENSTLHVVFLPFFLTSHMIPLVNAARLFASHGVKATIITTPSNAALFRSATDHEIRLGHKISVCTLQFPAAEVGLPEGVENFASATSNDMVAKVNRGASLLQKPMENLILHIRPHCIFSDMLHPWTNDVAEKLNIPRLSFYPATFLSLCVRHNRQLYAPHKKVNSNSEGFLVPGLPYEIKMKGSQVETETAYAEAIMKIIEKTDVRSYGMVHDTIYDLEPAWVDYYKKLKGKKYWTIGPLFHFSNREETDIASKSHSCFEWLDTQEPDTVLFICFGSMVQFSEAQLKEIALALEATNQPFIWVLRNKEEKTQENEKESSWLPHGFEERLNKSNMGLIIRSWAPQVMILRHPAVGGFMTHCGWNSSLEAITSGVPLITWPLFAEQFCNEKLIEIQQLGVSVGADVWNPGPVIDCAVLGSKKIEEAIKRLMGNSEESKKIRQKAEEASAMAKKAVQEGGSSYQNLIALIEELKSCALGLND